MREELRRIHLAETVPEIRVPSKELIRRLEGYPLVPELIGETLQLIPKPRKPHENWAKKWVLGWLLEMFRNGHFNESVRKAAERFEATVQNKSDSSEIGQKLMARVFNLSAPVIPLNSLVSENGKVFRKATCI